MAPSVVTVCAAMNTWTTCPEGNGTGVAAVADIVTEATTVSAAPRIKIFFIVPPLLRQGAADLDREAAVVMAVCARELEGALGLGELPRRLQHGEVGRDREVVAAFVSAAARAGENLEGDRSGLAGELARARERDARLLAGVGRA